MLPLKPRTKAPEVTIDPINPSFGLYYNPNGSKCVTRIKIVESKVFVENTVQSDLVIANPPNNESLSRSREIQG